MAYGKDKAVLQNTGSFRQRANSYSQRQGEQRKRGSGGQIPFFVGQYKPPKDSDPDTIRILEGQYTVQEVRGEGDHAEIVPTTLPFFPFTEHFDGRQQKSCICSAGPFAGNKKKANPCHGCDIFWSTREVGPDGKKKSDRMSKQDKYAFSIIDYGNYHKMPQIDRQTGQIRKADDGTPYYNWVKCTGLGCDGCKAQCETVQGQTKHWSMGWGHYNSLLASDEEVGRSCVNCGGVDTITGRAWVCPGCGDGIIDLATTSLKKEQVKETVDKEFHCNCGFHGFLNEIIQCSHCTPQGGSARRATIFDVDMQVKRVSSAKGDSDATQLIVVRWSAPRAIDQRFVQLAKPMQLDKIYTPTPLETQATQFAVPASGVNRQPRNTGDISSGAANPPPSAFVPQGMPGMGMPQMGPPPMGPPPQMGQHPLGYQNSPIMQPPPMMPGMPQPMAPAPGFAPPQQPMYPQPPMQHVPQVPGFAPAMPAPAQWPGLIPPKQ